MGSFISTADLSCVCVFLFGYFLPSFNSSKSTFNVKSPERKPNANFITRERKPFNRKVELTKPYLWNSKPAKIRCPSFVLDPNSAPRLSVIILTYKNSELLLRLLDALCSLRSSWSYEVIVADNGCFAETKAVVERYGASTSGTSTSAFVKYLAICTNEKYAVANNKAVGVASKSTEWFLFLNDDVMPMSGFLTNFQVRYPLIPYYTMYSFTSIFHFIIPRLS